MALKGKLEFEVKLKANADQFYQTLRRQSHEIPRMSSDKVQGVHIQKGDGKSKGSVKKWDYTLQEISAMETIEVADDSKKMITFKIMDGEIMKAFKNFKATAQAIPEEEGCLVKWILEYEKRSQNILDPVDYRELATKICRDMAIGVSGILVIAGITRTLHKILQLRDPSTATSVGIQSWNLNSI